jgi:hypothetical protein
MSLDSYGSFEGELADDAFPFPGSVASAADVLGRDSTPLPLPELTPPAPAAVGEPMLGGNNEPRSFRSRSFPNIAIE